MEKIIADVDQILRDGFPGATTELELLDERVTGFLIWEGFEGLEQMDRRKPVNKVLIDALGPNFREHVSMIFLMTPAEMSAMRGEVEI